jgi:ACS family hexuronate transporter-like MFS transporter
MIVVENPFNKHHGTQQKNNVIMNSIFDRPDFCGREVVIVAAAVIQATRAGRHAMNAKNEGGRLRWSICAMLFYATTVNYMDRQVLGILSPTLQHSIGWTEAQYGYIIAAFQIAYAVGLVVAGRVIDRIGSRVGYALVMSVWSVAAASHALARTPMGFGIARFFLGLGESGNFPAALKTIAEWFPHNERSLAAGIFNSGANLGAILAPLLIPFITAWFGWRYAFLATSAFSLIWVIIWLAFYRKPSEHPRLSPAELSFIQSDPIESSSPIPLGRLLRYRQLWAFPVAKFLTDPVWWFYLYWLPKFFDARYHVSLLQLGLPLVIVYNASAIGSISGGWLPGMLHRHGFSMAKARFSAMLLCACLAVPVLFANRLSSLWSAVSLLSVAAAAHQGFSANLFTIPSDLFPKKAVASVVGIGGTAGSVGGVLFSIATGWILQATHNYTLLFSIAAGAYLVALLLLFLIVPKLARIEDPA